MSGTCTCTYSRRPIRTDSQTALPVLQWALIPAWRYARVAATVNRCGDPLVYCFAEHDNMAIFDQQVRAMRTWMKNHGQQNKPLIISEYSLL